MTYLAEAANNKVKAIDKRLEGQIQDEGAFALTDEQLQILEKEQEMHVSGKSKSYSREEANQIIKGLRIF